MANYGKYYIAARLLLLKQYLEANAGRNRYVKRSELEDFLSEHDMPVEKKTLYADFAALGDICGLQLEYDPQKGLLPPEEILRQVIQYKKPEDGVKAPSSGLSERKVKLHPHLLREWKKMARTCIRADMIYFLSLSLQ